MYQGDGQSRLPQDSNLDQISGGVSPRKQNTIWAQDIRSRCLFRHSLGPDHRCRCGPRIGLDWDFMSFSNFSVNEDQRQKEILLLIVTAVETTRFSLVCLEACANRYFCATAQPLCTKTIIIVSRNPTSPSDSCVSSMQRQRFS